MTIDEKYTKLKSIFFKDFVVATENYNCRGTNIPASKVTKSNTTGLKVLYWGDGTINMAEYLHYLYVEAVLGDKSCVDKIYWCLKSIERLSLSAYEDEKMKNPNVYFKYEPGFFLRDDISVNSKDLLTLSKWKVVTRTVSNLKMKTPVFLLLSHKTKFGTYFHLLH